MCFYSMHYSLEELLQYSRPGVPSHVCYLFGKSNPLYALADPVIGSLPNLRDIASRIDDCTASL